MTTRLRIVHKSRYRYPQAVQASYNEARLTPIATPWQIPLESNLRVPQASWQYRYQDYWGTQVNVFEALQPHKELVVEANSLVEVDDTRRAAPDASVGWDVVRGEDVHQRLGEVLVQTETTAPDPELAAAATELAAGRGPHDAALAICSYLGDEMSYVPGSTGVKTTAAEAWTARSGVCQDYAHLLIGALRHVGLPARYVSGYLHPSARPALGATELGQSHAWVEWWSGQWTGHDPTNDTPPSERHVIVARARDYRDVPPIRGILAGTAATSVLDVSVELTRLA